eukprot:TRINITY_DN2078_c0_g1_i1.p1 TRINITY_DN2078_c0_g1~~TRINITY_DN2078_c0_g1_i1.p1  ORF type:complete len:481 (-),score=61.51 TRINITY_DN2078_c0_g1_i1:514-1956(-)
MIVNNFYYYLPYAEQSQYKTSLELSVTPFSMTYLDSCRDTDINQLTSRFRQEDNKIFLDSMLCLSKISKLHWSDHKERVKIAKEAISIYEGCSDAYCILAEHSAKDTEEAESYYQTAMSKAHSAYHKSNQYQKESKYNFLLSNALQRSWHGYNLMLFKNKKFGECHDKTVKYIKQFGKTEPRGLENLKHISSMHRHKVKFNRAFAYYHYILVDYKRLMMEGDDTDEIDISNAYISNPHVPNMLINSNNYCAPEKYRTGTSSEAIAICAVCKPLWHMEQHEALETLEKLCKSPKDLPYNETKILNLKDKGNSYFHKKEYAKALKIYEESLKLAGNSPLASILVSNKSACLHQMGEYKANIVFLDKYLPLDPHYTKLFFRKAQSLEALRFYVPAYHLTKYATFIDKYEVSLKKMLKQYISTIKTSKDNDANIKNCSNCGKLNQKYRCTYCNVAHYCDHNCQISHWYIHRPICFKWKKKNLKN